MASDKHPFVRRDFSPEEELALRFAAKADIRKTIGAIRRALPKDAWEQRSAKVRDALASLPELTSARTIASFIAMRGEPNIAPLMRQYFAEGRTIALPTFSYEDERPVLRAWTNESSVELSPLGFSQPDAKSPVVPFEQVDVILVPAVAMDERGERVGRGKGYYDALLRETTRACRVAVIFDFQWIAEAPHTPGDERVPVIVTDERITRVDEYAR